MDSRKKESSKGVIGGLITGSSNLVQGLSSGITGLVTRPMEGGRKGGAAWSWAWARESLGRP